MAQMNEETLTDLLTRIEEVDGITILKNGVCVATRCDDAGTEQDALLCFPEGVEPADKAYITDRIAGLRDMVATRAAMLFLLTFMLEREQGKPSGCRAPRHNCQ